MAITRATTAVVVHRHDETVYASEPALALLGRSRRQLLDRSVTDVIAASSRDQLREQLRRLEVGDADVLAMAVKLEDSEYGQAIAISSPVQWEGQHALQTTFVGVHGTELQTELRDEALENAPIGVTIADMSADDAPLIYVNDRFVETTGYQREDTLGQNCRFLQGERTRPEPVTRMREAIDAGESVTVELRNYRKDGSMFWNRVSLSPITNSVGVVTHYLGFQEDVSDKKVFEHEKVLFKQKADAAEQAMFVTDRAGTIEYVNPAFERLTGYTAEEAIGANPRILKSEQQDAAFYEQLWETITAGEVWESELTNKTKHGERYRVRQKIIPITDDHGTITQFAAIEYDISTQQLTEQVVDVLNRVLRHNLRSSINIIEGYAAMLADQLEDPDQQATAALIRERAGAMEDLSEQATAIRNLVEHRDSAHRWEVSELHNLVGRFREQYEAATITLTVADGAAEIGTVTNGELFGLAIEEAIENALIHNDRPDPTVEITVSRPPEANELRIDILDDGPGIPNEEWEVIQIGTETPLLHASGLGLWIINWGLTALGGSVTLSSPPQGGKPVDDSSADRNNRQPEQLGFRSCLKSLESLTKEEFNKCGGYMGFDNRSNRKHEPCEEGKQRRPVNVGIGDERVSFPENPFGKSVDDTEANGSGQKECWQFEYSVWKQGNEDKIDAGNGSNRGDDVADDDAIEHHDPGGEDAKRDRAENRENKGNAVVLDIKPGVDFGLFGIREDFLAGDLSD